MKYAGIGSRETPVPILVDMRSLAQDLAAGGWTLRTGGADGADIAFETGHRSGGGADALEVYLPWNGYNGRSTTDEHGTFVLDPPALAIGRDHRRTPPPGVAPLRPGRQEAPRAQRRHHPRAHAARRRRRGRLLDAGRRPHRRHRHGHPARPRPRDPRVQPVLETARGPPPRAREHRTRLTGLRTATA